MFTLKIHLDSRCVSKTVHLYISLRNQYFVNNQINSARDRCQYNPSIPILPLKLTSNLSQQLARISRCVSKLVHLYISLRNQYSVNNKINSARDWCQYLSITLGFLQFVAAGHLQSEVLCRRLSETCKNQGCPCPKIHLSMSDLFNN